ncbi:MAG TPA: pyridoxal 5'-phosphate synthase glutaminase subunit PdxT [Peptococcaceae bacterium]|nr:pyridoxal 5'-phosphate synthase glutaminase subunit PdxT [Peptococcaceae bacterium]
MRVGVLAAQGAFREHIIALRACGVDASEVRKAEQLDGIDALVLPGGESTAIARLLQDFGMFDKVRALGEAGLPIFGTCAGMVLLAKEIERSGQPRLGLMDITVRRNAFGRQVESFEADLDIPVLGKEPLRGVFIRAPYVTSAGPGVRVLATLDDKIVLVEQGKFLAAAFHPELTDDLRLHQYFLAKI